VLFIQPRGSERLKIFGEEMKTVEEKLLLLEEENKILKHELAKIKQEKFLTETKQPTYTRLKIGLAKNAFNVILR
jgi:hypothetical protein